LRLKAFARVFRVFFHKIRKITTDVVGTLRELENVRMWKCENVKMWRCENVKILSIRSQLFTRN